MSHRDDWRPDDSQVLIVAGREARNQALNEAIYECQNRRGFRPSRWIAFYCDGRIDTMAEIDGPPEDDVASPGTSGKAWTCGDLRTVVRLKSVTSIGPIENDKRDRLGRATAWTQRQGYTTIDKLLSANQTSGL